MRKLSQAAQQMNGRSIPVLITWDVDPDSWMPIEERQWALNTAMDICYSLGIHATFFITARPAHLFSGEIEKMQAQGHEIGCHGLTHKSEEDYNRMPPEMQRAYIEEATEKIESLLSTSVRAFRSPRVKTSANTLRLLSEYGYQADSSVCSQRIDLVSSNLINANWFFSPRHPYHPHRDNAFKRGELGIWEIPVSALVIPFISATLQVLGLSATKVFFRLLLAEARLTGKPIVYLAHPTEFATSDQGEKKTARQRYATHLRHEFFTPSYIRTHGLRLRNLLYRLDAASLLRSTEELFAYMASFADVHFMTVSEYVVHLNNG
jgi:hypothetical protein